MPVVYWVFNLLSAVLSADFPKEPKIAIREYRVHASVKAGSIRFPGPLSQEMDEIGCAKWHANKSEGIIEFIAPRDVSQKRYMPRA